MTSGHARGKEGAMVCSMGPEVRQEVWVGQTFGDGQHRDNAGSHKALAVSEAGPKRERPRSETWALRHREG